MVTFQQQHLQQSFSFSCTATEETTGLFEETQVNETNNTANADVTKLEAQLAQLESELATLEADKAEKEAYKKN